MISIVPPLVVQHRAWEAAYVLREDFADRLTLEQNIRMEVIRRVAPERLGWPECGDAFATHAQIVTVRV